MPKRNAWESLSDAYRRRLERGGIDRAGYERGESLKGARGHKPGQTPEHPSDLFKTPEQYTDYRERRQEREKRERKNDKTGGVNTDRDELVERALRNAVRQLGEGFRFNEERIKRNLKRMTKEELLDAATINADEWRRRARKQGKFNPWWYR
jgi:hypothetical protein